MEGHTYQEGYTVYSNPGSGLWVGTRIGLYQYDHQKQFVKEINPKPGEGKINETAIFYNRIIAGQDGVSFDNMGLPVDIDGATKRFVVGATGAGNGQGKVIFGKIQ